MNADYDDNRQRGPRAKLPCRYLDVLKCDRHVERLPDDEHVNKQGDKFLELSPSEIRYTHDTILSKFESKSFFSRLTIRMTLKQLVFGEIGVDDIEPMSVFRSNGYYWSVNNRRLWVFKHFERLGGCDKVRVRLIRRYFGKITTTTGGKDIKVRDRSADLFPADLPDKILKFDSTEGCVTGSVTPKDAPSAGHSRIILTQSQKELLCFHFRLSMDKAISRPNKEDRGKSAPKSGENHAAREFSLTTTKKLSHKERKKAKKKKIRKRPEKDDEHIVRDDSQKITRTLSNTEKKKAKKNGRKHPNESDRARNDPSRSQTKDREDSVLDCLAGLTVLDYDNLLDNHDVLDGYTELHHVDVTDIINVEHVDNVLYDDNALNYDDSLLDYDNLLDYHDVLDGYTELHHVDVTDIINVEHVDNVLYDDNALNYDDSLLDYDNLLDYHNDATW